MRILYVINDLSTGGTEHLMVKHLQQLRGLQAPIELKVVVLGSDDSADTEYLERLQYPPIFLGFSGRYRSLKATFKCLWRLRRVIQQFKPNLLHSFLWNANVFTELARRGLGIPHIVHVVDRRGDRNAQRLFARLKVGLTGYLLRGDDLQFVAVSEACREHAIRQWQINPHRIMTVHNGIPVAEFLVPTRNAGDRKEFVIGTISNFTEEKGHRYLFEAIALMKNQSKHIKLKIAGGGRSIDKTRLEACVSQLGIGDQVEFIGKVPSAASFYREINLFVIPSISAEGLPTTILEAMAAQLPVVATDIGGAREAITDGIEGLIVPARDPVALAGAISALINDPDRMQDLGEAALRRVRQSFSIENMTAIIVKQVYHPLLNADRKLWS